MNHKEPITVHGTSIFKEKANYERRRTKDGVMLSSHLVDEVDTMMSPQHTKTRKRKSRGTTTLPTIIKNKSNGVKLVLQYDANGEVTGAHRDNYRSYLGVLARTMVPITYKDWFKVPRHLKDKLWTCLEGVFVVDPRSRKKSISDISGKWRTFKKNLTTYIYDFMSYPEIISKPPEEYDDVVEQETWDLFLKERLSEEFKELRKKQQIRRSFNIYNHKLGRSGYFGLARKLKTKPDEEFDRSYLWKMARRNKNGEYDNEEIIKLVSKIDEVSKHVEEGKISIEGIDDILTKALGKPEHSGRVRGVEGSVTPSVYFHTPRHVSHSKCEDEVKRLEAQIQQMRNQMDALVQDAARTPQSDHDSNVSRTDIIEHPQNDHIEMETFVSATKKLDHVEIDQMILVAKKDMGRNDCQATKINPPGGNDVQPPISTPTKKKSELCKLAVGSPNNIVAHGTVYERVGPDEKIHTIPLGESNVRVSVDRTIVKDALLPFPIPGEDNTIGGAIGFQLAWPKNLVLIGSDQAISNKAEWLNNVKSIDSFANKNTVERNDVHPTKKITVKGNDVQFAKINTVGRNDVQAKKINLPGGSDVRPPSSTLERKQSGRCKLAVGSPDNIVAHGMMYESVGPDEKIHTIPLGEKNVRVSVDHAIVKDAILPFPIP